MQPPTLDESIEVRLESSLAEKQSTRVLEELYAIFQATEHLESAFVSSLVTGDAYKAACNKLLGAYRIQEATLRAGGAFPDVTSFLAAFRVHLPRAVKRLVEEGVPATVTGAHSGSGGGDMNLVSRITTCLITACDALNMGHLAVDQISPYISDCCENLNAFAALPPAWEPRKRLAGWLGRFRGMAATDVLSADDTRQLLHDLQNCLSSFQEALRGVPG